jgi:hypothetical protein
MQGPPALGSGAPVVRLRAERSGGASPSAWKLNFNDGSRNENHLDNVNDNNRALCVRRSGA